MKWAWASLTDRLSIGNTLVDTGSFLIGNCYQKRCL